MKYKNNPFNIRYVPQNRWRGQIAPKDGFCQFDTMDDGIRAMCRLLLTYFRKGFNTPEKIIYRFAPPSENLSRKYLAFVCLPSKDCDYIDPHEVLRYPSPELALLIKRMAYIETNIDLRLEHINRFLTF